MTTPAVSRNKWLQVTGHTVSCSNYWNPQCKPPATYAGAFAEWVAESRPASVSRRKTASGWREPTSWNHAGSHLYYPEMPIFQNQVSQQGKLWWTRTYYDYAGWNQSVWTLPGFPVYLEDRAVNKALARLKAKRPNVNLSVAFGERREAADMMADRVTSIAKSVRRFRHLRPREWGQVIKHGAKNELRNIPGSWLEVQYGWKPLMSDVHAACQALNEREQSQDAYRASVKGAVVEKSTVRWVKTSDVSSRFQFQTDIQMTAVSVVRLHYLLRNPFIQSLASMGVTNPAELVWELVPYSFVVDWFLPVGNYLQLLDADFGWDFKTGTMTRYQRGEGSGPLVLVDGRPYDRVIQGQISLKTYRHSRVIVTSSPWPRLPHFKNPLSLGHVANAMSLLVQAFK